MNDEMLDALDEIYANANRLVASVQDDQWEDKTPCTEWNVRDLVDHMTGTSKICYAAATRTDLDVSAGAGRGSVDDVVTPAGDAAAAFGAAAAQAAGAWRGAGALDGMVSVPAEMPAVRPEPRRCRLRPGAAEAEPSGVAGCGAEARR